MVPRVFERYREIIPDYADFLKALEEPLPAHVRVNTLKISPTDLEDLMARRGYRLEPVHGCPGAYIVHGAPSAGGTLEYALGYYHRQGLTSMLPVLVLSPEPGETLLDLCAAPGGKTTQAAERMTNRGLVVANDVTLERLGVLRATVDRLGATVVATTRYRGESFPKRVPFQRVLVDPPCSAEGTFRQRTRSLVSEEPGAIPRLARLQGRLLARALDILAPGGTLVYSTCTYAPEENEAVLDPFVRAGTVQLQPAPVALPHAPGILQWGGRDFHPDLTRAVRCYPHLVNSLGFFLARLRKRG